MINICTVANYDFILKFLALRESIRKYTLDYKIHLICLDDKMFLALKEKYEDIVCHSLETLLKSDKELEKARSNKPSFEALNVAGQDYQKAQEIQFIWAMASYSCWYCLEKLGLEDITYIDADIYFFNTPEILNDFKDFCSIGLIENRTPYSPINGKYNVGIIYFKNDPNGVDCSRFWKNCLLDQDNKHAAEYGSCGDQKYLELFPQLFEGVFELDQFIGQLAPWSVSQHNFIANKMIWNGKVQDLLFYHFSNFDCDFEKKTYVPAKRHGLINLQNNSFVHSLYEEYYNCLENLNEDFIRHDRL